MRAQALTTPSRDAGKAEGVPAYLDACPFIAPLGKADGTLPGVPFRASGRRAGLFLPAFLARARLDISLPASLAPGKCSA